MSWRKLERLIINEDYKGLNALVSSVVSKGALEIACFNVALIELNRGCSGVDIPLVGEVYKKRDEVLQRVEDNLSKMGD